MAVKESAQQRRARARTERRERASQGAPGAADDTRVDGESASAHDPGEAIRNAASAAFVGAAVGAAKALARRRAEAGEPGSEGESAPQPEGDRSASEPEPGPGVQAQPEPEPEPEREREPTRRRAASSGDAREAVRRAKDELLELLDAEADRVSAVTRTDEGWRIGLEVVELRRVPDSTDVLATYEVELTDEGGLLSFERTRRYYRSEADKQ